MLILNRTPLAVFTLSIAYCVFFPQSSVAQDAWPAFRGDGSGTLTKTTPPLRWSPESGIAWKTRVEGYGQSSPLIWNNTAYLTSTDGPFQERCLVHAIDLKTGEQRWLHESKASWQAENYFRNSRSAPTGTVDGAGVYSFFPSGDVIATSHEGTLLWSVGLVKRFGSVDNERGIASSLAQTDDSLYAVIDHQGPSYMVAIDKQTGKVLWKTDRGDRVPSWSSPVVAHFRGRDIVVVSSSDTVDAYDAKQGGQLWSIPGIKGNHIPSASVVDDRIYIGSTTMYGGESDSDEVAGSNCCIEVTDENGAIGYKLLWGAERANSYYSTPLAFGDYVYYVNKVGVLYCVYATTGKQVYAKRIGNACWASAIGVVGSRGQERVYLFQKNGITIVLKPGDEFDQLARNQTWSATQMAEDARLAATARVQNKVPAELAKPKSGPERVFAGLPEKQLHQMFSYNDPTVYAAAASGGRLLIRTGQHLYCITGTE